jgi:hypothetical protein
MPLTNLFKKSSRTYEWDEACNATFENLKGILVKTLVFKLPNFDKDFETHFDVFDLVIRGVLMQNGKSIVFKSKKLNETK